MKTGIRIARTLALVLIAGAAVAVAEETAKPTEREPAKPARFDNHGLTLQYDPAIKLEEQWKDEQLTVTLKGPHDLLFIVQVAKIPLFSGEDYAMVLVNGMHDGMDSAGAKVTKVEDWETKVAGKDCEGGRFSYDLAGVKNKYAACGIKKDGMIVAVSLQHPADKDSALAETIGAIVSSIDYEEPD